MSLNSITVEGNLTKDAKFWPAEGEKRDFAVGGMAVNSRDKDADPIFFTLKAGGFVAKQLNLLKKGDRVVVSGRIEPDNYVSKETGAKVVGVAIQVNDVSRSTFVSVAAEVAPEKEESVGF